MAKSAFGSSVPKFTNHGLHPKLQTYNTEYSKSISNNIGPGSYQVCWNKKSSQNRFNTEMWKHQYSLELQKRFPHFMIKEKKHAESEMKRRLGPGTYNIDLAMDTISKSAHATTVLQSKATRFNDAVKDCFPGPSTYGIPQDMIDESNNRRKYSSAVSLLDRGGNSDRLPPAPSFHIGPGIYNFESPVDQVLRHQIGKRGYYDCNSIDRSLPIKTGHHAILVTHNLGPGQYNFKNDVDRFQDEFNCYKGKFLREEQYPPKPYQRVFWSDPGNTPVDETNQVSPASYCIVQPNKTKKSKAGFGSSDVRMNKFALANFMGENNTLIGPGRYNCNAKEIGESGNGHESVFKSLVPNVSNARISDVLRHRVRPLNIPEQKKHKSTHMATENSLAEYHNIYKDLKSLIIS